MMYQNQQWLDNFWRQVSPQQQPQPLAGQNGNVGGGAANMMAGATPNALAQPGAVFGKRRRQPNMMAGQMQAGKQQPMTPQGAIPGPPQPQLPPPQRPPPMQRPGQAMGRGAGRAYY